MSSGKRRLTPEVRARLLKDIADKGGDIRMRQLTQWVGNAAWCADQLASPVTATRSVAALFWIRLFGTLHDVRKALRSHQKLHADAGVPEESLLTRAAGALDALLDGLSHEELVYIDYRRQVECHPFQDSYRLKLRKDGTLRDQRNSNLAGEVDLDDAERIVAAMERERGFDTIAVAVAMAARIRGDLDRAVDAVNAYCSPR